MDISAVTAVGLKVNDGDDDDDSVILTGFQFDCHVHWPIIVRQSTNTGRQPKPSTADSLDRSANASITCT